MKTSDTSDTKSNQVLKLFEVLLIWFPFTFSRVIFYQDILLFYCFLKICWTFCVVAQKIVKMKAKQELVVFNNSQ